MKVTQTLTIPSSNIEIFSSLSDKKLEEGLGAIAVDEPIASNTSAKEENRDEGDNMMSLLNLHNDDNARASNDDRENCDGSDGSNDAEEADLNLTPVQSFGDYMVQGTIDLVRSVSSTLSFTSPSTKVKTAVDASKADMIGPEEIKEQTEGEANAVQDVNGNILLAKSMSAISFGSTSFKSGAKSEVAINIDAGPDLYSVKKDGKDVQDILDEGIKTVPSTNSTISFGSFLGKKEKVAMNTKEDPDVNSVKEDDKDVQEILNEGIQTVPSTSSAISFGSFLSKKKSV